MSLGLYLLNSTITFARPINSTSNHSQYVILNFVVIDITPRIYFNINLLRKCFEEQAELGIFSPLLYRLSYLGMLRDW
jgi:hypothetical protein